IRTSEREEAGAAGAAMIAAVCVGQYASMDDCVSEWVTPLLRAAEPSDRKLAAAYEAIAPSYALAHEALRPVWRSMAASRQTDVN
ncbi:MAG: carbohydrate kinase, partial [Mesorhizobium sp.]